MQSVTEYRDAFPTRPLSPTKSISRTDWRAAEKPFFGVTQYGEAFTGAPVHGVAEAASAAALAASLRATRPTGGALGRTGTSHLMSTTTSYGDVDGPGANPWKLMESLGLPAAEAPTRRSAPTAGALSPVKH